VVFELSGGVTFMSRILEGTFPAYQKIVPSGYATRCVFDASALSAQIKRAAIFTQGGSGMLKIDVDADSGQVKFCTASPAVGEYEGEMEVEVEGSENKIAFNSRYLLEFLAKMRAREVVLEMNRGDTPGLWRVSGVENYKYVVMPMNRD
jgi:DNA polymerase-3 subunit beta